MTQGDGISPPNGGPLAIDLIAFLRRLWPKTSARPGNWFQWRLARRRYRRQGIALDGKPSDRVWYFAYGANMHDATFRERRRMKPIEWRVGSFRGYRLRFNLDGNPVGKSAPANVSPDPDGEVWGVLYLITRADLVHLDWTEGLPARRRYRHLWIEAEDVDGNSVNAVTYMADGNENDGRPSLRYITLIRDGAKAHGLPEDYLRFLNDVKSAE